MTTLRSDWFGHVEKTRKKLSKGKKEKVEHRVAMKAASITWPKEKEKLLKRRRREAKKIQKVNVPQKNAWLNKRMIKKTRIDFYCV